MWIALLAFVAPSCAGEGFIVERACPLFTLPRYSRALLNSVAPGLGVATACVMISPTILKGLPRGECYISSSIPMNLIAVVMIIQYLVFRMIGDKALF